jgi:hypothetical protein
MKIRSAVLLACMLVVPALAMFSHRLPAGARAAVREAFSRAVSRWASPASSDAVREHLIDDGAPGGAVQTPPQSVAAQAAMPTMSAASPAANSAAAAPPLSDEARRRWEEELGRLGAVKIDCRPLLGADGVHVASCGVPLDASGQLVRVFHASGTDPAAAIRALFDDVAGWRQRSVGRGRPEPVVGGQPATDRQRL